MLLRRFFGNPDPACARKVLRATQSLLDTVGPVVCERLEPRQLLTTYEYTVPAHWNAAYLVSTTAGEVEVRRDFAGGEVGTRFDVGQGMYVVKATTNGFLFVDGVRGDFKPGPDLDGDNGIMVELTNNATGGHLRVEGTVWDDLIRITESSSIGTTVAVKAFGVDGNTRTGAGVDKLTIQTADDADAVVRVATDEFASPDLPGLSPTISLTIDSRGDNDSIHLGGAVNASVNAVVRAGAPGSKVWLEQSEPPGGTTRAEIDFDPGLGGDVGDGVTLRIGHDLTGLNCDATLQRPLTGSHIITLDEIFMGHGDYLDELPPGTTRAKLTIASETRVGREFIIGHDFLTELEQDPLAVVNAPLTVANATFDDGIFWASGEVDFNAGVRTLGGTEILA